MLLIWARASTTSFNDQQWPVGTGVSFGSSGPRPISAVKGPQSMLEGRVRSVMNRPTSICFPHNIVGPLFTHPRKPGQHIRRSFD